MLIDKVDDGVIDEDQFGLKTLGRQILGLEEQVSINRHHDHSMMIVIPVTVLDISVRGIYPLTLK